MSDPNNIARSLIKPGHKNYFLAQRLAFTEIKELERLVEIRAHSSPYILGPWDHYNDCPEYIENLEPWEMVAKFQDRIAKNPNLIKILTAQNRLDLLTS